MQYYLHHYTQKSILNLLYFWYILFVCVFFTREWDKLHEKIQKIDFFQHNTKTTIIHKTHQFKNNLINKINKITLDHTQMTHTHILFQQPLQLYQYILSLLVPSQMWLRMIKFLLVKILNWQSVASLHIMELVIIPSWMYFSQELRII